MTEQIVSNTGPLIALTIIDRLDILRKLYDEVFVTEQVHHEILQGGVHDIGVSAYRKTAWIRQCQLSRSLEPSLQTILDPGEASVIQFACERNIPLVLIDERKGRKVARVLYGLRVIGTAGILIKAKRAGLFHSIREPLREMQNRGYRIHDSIVEFALKAVGEKIR